MTQDSNLDMKINIETVCFVMKGSQNETNEKSTNRSKFNLQESQRNFELNQSIIYDGDALALFIYAAGTAR